MYLDLFHNFFLVLKKIAFGGYWVMLLVCFLSDGNDNVMFCKMSALLKSIDKGIKTQSLLLIGYDYHLNGTLLCSSVETHLCTVCLAKGRKRSCHEIFFLLVSIFKFNNSYCCNEC